MSAAGDEGGEAWREIYEQALRWLARRAYGQRELERRLLSTGAAVDGVNRALARCVALGYLDDRAFAESRVRLRARRGYGPERVRAELLYLGVAAGTVEDALRTWPDEADPVERAAAELVKRFGLPGAGQTGEDAGRRSAEKRRRWAFLARRGFDAEVIRQVLGEAC